MLYSRREREVLKNMLYKKEAKRGRRGRCERSP